MLIGIVGKPSSGKSSFFKAATMVEVAIADYPFTTIEPNEGVAYVRVPCPEKHFGVKCNPRHGFCIDGNRFVPVKLLDVAGLIPGAHEGKGLGNKFLDDLRQADVLIHVVDASGMTNEKGERTTGYDPLRDIKFLEDEINMWFFSILKRAWNRFAKGVKDPVRDIARQFSGLKISESHVKQALEGLEKPLRQWSDEELFSFAKKLREIAKPIVIAANKCDVPEARKNVRKLRELGAVPTSALAEIALREYTSRGVIKYVPGDSEFEIIKANEKERRILDFIRKQVLEPYGSTGVQQVLNKAVFDVLKYVVVYPVKEKLADGEGRILPDAFLLPPGSTVADLASRIHSEIGEKAIKAMLVKEKKIVGKDYELKNGDVVKVIF